MFRSSCDQYEYTIQSSKEEKILTNSCKLNFLSLPQETALTYLHYGRAKYRKEKNIIQRILNVNQIADVKSICLSIKVANKKELEENATRILQQYRESKELSEEHPQYDAMAVYQTSKMMKIKINEDKLIDVSHLNRSQWTNLKNIWHRWLEENKITLATNPKKNGSSNGIKLFREIIFVC